MSGRLGRQGREALPALRRALAVGLSLSMALGGAPAYALEDAAGAAGAGTGEQADASAWQDDDLASVDADGTAGLGTGEATDDLGIGAAIDDEDTTAEEQPPTADEDPLEEDVPEDAEKVAEPDDEDATDAADLTATKKGAAAGVRSEYSIEAVGDQTYTGGAIEPKPKVTMVNVFGSAGEQRIEGPYTLVEGADYTLRYQSNVNVGTATVTAVERLGRTIAETTFRIVQADVAGTKVATVKKQAYTGKPIKPTPKVTYKGQTLQRGTDYTLSYKNNKKAGTATVIVRGRGNFKGTKKATFKIVAATVSYQAYGQSYGAQASKSNGTIAGKPGKSKRLEGIKVRLAGKHVSGSIKCNALLQNGRWQGWKKAGTKAGAAGKRIEAVKIKLTGKMAKAYDVWYRVHAQNLGWMGWAKNGAAAGTTGYSYRLEAIQVVLRPKGSKAPAASFKGAKRHTKAAFKKNDGTITGRTYETADFKITAPASWAGKWKLEKVEKNVRFGNANNWGTRYMFDSKAQGKALVYVGNAGAKRFSSRTQTALGDYPEIGVSSRGRAVNGSFTPFFGYVTSNTSGDVTYLSDTISSGFYNVGAHAYITVK